MRIAATIPIGTPTKMERTQLAERAAGKMARMRGGTLPGESQKELNHIARKDQLRV